MSAEEAQKVATVNISEHLSLYLTDNSRSDASWHAALQDAPVLYIGEFYGYK